MLMVQSICSKMWKLQGLVVTHILPGWWQGDPAHHLQGAGSSCKNKIWGIGDNTGTSARISIIQRKAIEIFLGHRVTLAGLHLVTLGGTVEVPLLCDTAWDHSLCGHRPRAAQGPFCSPLPFPSPSWLLLVSGTNTKKGLRTTTSVKTFEQPL